MKVQYLVSIVFGLPLVFSGVAALQIGCSVEPGDIDLLEKPGLSCLRGACFRSGEGLCVFGDNDIGFRLVPQTSVQIGTAAINDCVAVPAGTEFLILEAWVRRGFEGDVLRLYADIDVDGLSERVSVERLFPLEWRMEIVDRATHNK